MIKVTPRNSNASGQVRHVLAEPELTGSQPPSLETASKSEPRTTAFAVAGALSASMSGGDIAAAAAGDRSDKVLIVHGTLGARVAAPAPVGIAPPFA